MFTYSSFKIVCKACIKLLIFTGEKDIHVEHDVILADLIEDGESAQRTCTTLSVVKQGGLGHFNRYNLLRLHYAGCNHCGL